MRARFGWHDKQLEKPFQHRVAWLHAHRIAGGHHHHRLLAALLLPALAAAREHADLASCMNNNKRLLAGANVYATEYNDNWPPVWLAAHAYNQSPRNNMVRYVYTDPSGQAGVKIPNKITANQTFQNLRFFVSVESCRRRECLLLPRFYGKAQFIPRRSGIFPAADDGWPNGIMARVQPSAPLIAESWPASPAAT